MAKSTTIWWSFWSWLMPARLLQQARLPQLSCPSHMPGRIERWERSPDLRQTCCRYAVNGRRRSYHHDGPTCFSNSGLFWYPSRQFVCRASSPQVDKREPLWVEELHNCLTWCWRSKEVWLKFILFPMFWGKFSDSCVRKWSFVVELSFSFLEV